MTNKLLKSTAFLGTITLMFVMTMSTASAGWYWPRVRSNCLPPTPEPQPCESCGGNVTTTTTTVVNQSNVASVNTSINTGANSGGNWGGHVFTGPANSTATVTNTLNFNWASVTN